MIGHDGKCRFGGGMSEYRLYRLGARGKLVSDEILYADDDEAALATIRALKEPTACELWQRGRRVSTIPPFGLDQVVAHD